MPSLRSLVLLALPLANAVVQAEVTQPAGGSPALSGQAKELLVALPVDAIPDALRNHQHPASQDDWIHVEAPHEANGTLPEQLELKKRQASTPTSSAAVAASSASAESSAAAPSTTAQPSSSAAQSSAAPATSSAVAETTSSAVETSAILHDFFCTRCIQHECDFVGGVYHRCVHVEHSCSIFFPVVRRFHPERRDDVHFGCLDHPSSVLSTVESTTVSTTTAAPSSTEASTTAETTQQSSSTEAVVVPVEVTTTNSAGETQTVSSSALVGATAKVTTTDSEGKTTTAAAVIVETTDAAGNTVTTTSAASAYTPTRITTGQVLTRTNSAGSTFLTTYTGGSDGQVSSLVLSTTTLPNGERKTITSYATVAAAAATAGSGGTATGTNGEPSLQTGAAQRFGVEAAAALAGGVAGLAWLL
ncbi:hypothetical protein UCRNP2_2567 [Neofusicoccum parvum UCRNP2]|uniref:Uncharacterized protein n=1 Tax=Botryosphaeria parva (strain UCR-NP2) TaxID=1287680 RepID=R1ES81_BOTPV|nr:hypothetical protein UCRNP2_2567 [Neofusicoccum parvum UCRNP2]